MLCAKANRRLGKLALCGLEFALWCWFGALSAWAGGPRFVTGSGLWVQSGLVENWNTTQLQYFTDPGALNAAVPHAQADAMVAAAAAVWNVPTSSIALSQGGELGEHVSGANSYFNGTEFVFPADVEAANENAIPVAVIYDTDGSVTDLLLGSGASEPAGCRQNAVTESVDDIQQDGHIHHALIVLNGRCVGAAPEQLTQMQYQLARAFGRVLGLAWSQDNDNVFTAVNQVTADQETYWPFMHPLDVICGSYTYQCMPNPFTLRPDDLSSLATLYAVWTNSTPAGKQASDTDAAWLYTSLSFPNGQGMDWVNFTAHRLHAGVLEDFEVVSGITGAYYQQTLPSPVTGVQAENEGSNYSGYEGFVPFRVVPLGGLSNVYFTSEPINPLYWGEYALGPYMRTPVTPSGSSQTWTAYSALPYPDVEVGAGVTAWDAPSACNPDNDGTESAPAPLDATGWQSGLLCGWGHNSWWSATIRAGRTWAFEVTATDETGAASTGKAQTVFGIWNATDPTGVAPTVASVPVPFNSMAYGVTQAQMGAFASDTTLRFVVSELYGGGRPDFTYQARLLYADSVAPSSVGSSGGTVTLAGSGFREGMLVSVNGVAGTVKSVTDNTLVAVVPSAALTGAVIGSPVAITLTDTATGASTSIADALTYTQAPDVLRVATAPSELETGFTAATPFSVQVLASDGITPIAGATVSFAVSAGSATLSACAANVTCTVVTDSNGMVQTPVAGSALGGVTLTATELVTTPSDPGGANVSVQINLNDVAPVLTAAFVQTAVYVAAGAGGSWTLQLDAFHDGGLAGGVPVSWSATPGLTISSDDLASGADGAANVTVNTATVASGAVLTVTGCVWTNVCATWMLYGVDSTQWRAQPGAGTTQAVGDGVALQPVSVLMTDSSGHPLQGAPVAIYQRVLGWEGACTGNGPCAAAPVLSSTETSAVSDNNGAAEITPLQLADLPQTVEVAVSSGTTGFCTFTLSKAPAVP